MKNAKFKDSGVQWLGEIPQHWEVVPIRAIYSESDKRCGNTNFELLSVTIEKGIIKQSEVESKQDISNDDKSKYKIVPLNAIAYNKMRMWQGAVGMNEICEGIVSPAYVVVYPRQNFCNKFMSYLFRADFMLMPYNKYSYGICQDQNTLRIDDFLNIKIPLPPLDEQRRIAEFLDKKCEKIAEFIDKKQQIISLLKEQKLALINKSTCGRMPLTPYHTDTPLCHTDPLSCHTASPSCHTERSEVSKNKGVTLSNHLDSSVASLPQNDRKTPSQWQENKHYNGNQTHLKFKHSGIEWLGEIPQHWEIRKLKQIGVFNKGNNITKKYISDEGLPFIVYGDIYTKYNFKALNIAHKISNENANLATLVEKNTLLFSASGEIIEDIGKCVVLLADYAYIGGDVITLNAKNCDSVFLSYAINSAFAIYQKATMGKGDIIVHIHILNLKNLQIPLPPLDEQRRIAEFLDKKCEKIDKAIALIEQEIQAIKEYKTSLIDKAVRGGINV